MRMNSQRCGSRSDDRRTSLLPLFTHGDQLGYLLSLTRSMHYVGEDYRTASVMSAFLVLLDKREGVGSRSARQGTTTKYQERSKATTEGEQKGIENFLA